MKFLKNLAAFFGRMFLALLFAVYAYNQAFSNPSGARQWLELSSFAAVAGAILCEGLGAVSVFLGFRTQWGALLLIAIVGRAAWVSGGGGLSDLAFLKNLAVLGGLLILFSSGPGDWSMDGSGGGGGSKKSSKD